MTQPALLPLTGVLYVLRHPDVLLSYKRVAQTLGAGLASSLALLLVLYTRGWSVQAGIIYPILGKDSWFAFMALQTVLAAEAAAVLYLLLRRTLNTFSSNVFDQVLTKQGIQRVQPFSPEEVEELRAAAKAQNARTDAALRRRGLPEKTVRWVLGLVGQRLLTAPLLLIPGVGPLLYLYANALNEGTSSHAQYFKRKGVSDPDLQSVITQSRANEYRSFGAVQLLLNLIPVVNYIFAVGGAAGAALWAAEIETSGQKWLRSTELKKLT